MEATRRKASGGAFINETEFMRPRPLPVNGRDPSRGVPGNMTAAEAVGLAGRVRPRFVVPHHYDMFTFNTVPVSEFEDAARRLAPDVRPMVLKCGERWELQR